jgi:A/G-specific adenine glycosylase
MTARHDLLEWFAPRRRAYPWRGARDPYRVLVSEVMLQQTQAARVAPAYREFVRRFPSVRALAAASAADMLRAWGTLGYNRRAVALLAAARVIVREHGGRVPPDPGALAWLPGVGPYTAAAVASLGHGVPVAAIDTNVRRVVARARLGSDGASPGEVREAATRWLDRRDPGAWNQALMDLGRTVCRPVPRCDACPLAGPCRFRREGGRPGSPRRRQSRFEGSFRQLRGALVRELRGRSPMSLASLARETGGTLDRVAQAVVALSEDGLVAAGPAALAGRASGRVRLPT